MARSRPYPSLHSWRDANGYSQREAAVELGVSQTFYSRLERQRQAPNPQLAKVIVIKTGVPLEVVLGIA